MAAAARAQVDGGPLAAEVAPSVVHLLHEAARHAPDQPALTCGDETVTYAEYAGLVAGLARTLSDAIGRRMSMPGGFEREVLMQRLDDVYARAR